MNQGTFTFAGALSVPATTVGLSVAAGATLDITGWNPNLNTSGTSNATGITGNGTIGSSSTTAPSVITFNTASSTFAGSIVDHVGAGTQTVGLTVNSGTLTLTGASTYTGGTIINTGGTLQFGNGGTINAAVPIVNNSGGAVSFSHTDVATFAPQITGAGMVVQNGTGTVTLGNANNSYTGNTTVLAGTLVAPVLTNGGTNSSIGASTSDPSNIVLSGGALQYAGPTVSTDRLFSVTPIGGTLDASGTGPVTFANTGAILTADANSTGATTVTTSKVITGLTQVNDLVVGMAVNGGNLAGGDVITAINQAAKTITITNTPILAGQDTLTFGPQNRVLTLTGSNTGPNTLAGSLSDSGLGSTLGLNKTGVGTWVLTGANTNSGNTTITAGSLYVNSTGGTGTGPVTLNGGLLGGSGSITGSVAAGTGAHMINAGGSAGAIGTLSIGGNLTTNANTTLAFDLASPTGTNDLIAVAGASISVRVRASRSPRRPAMVRLRSATTRFCPTLLARSLGRQAMSSSPRRSTTSSTPSTPRGYPASSTSTAVTSAMQPMMARSI